MAQTAYTPHAMSPPRMRVMIHRLRRKRPGPEPLLSATGSSDRDRRNKRHGKCHRERRGEKPEILPAVLTLAT
jgi:hypothetical protein